MKHNGIIAIVFVIGCATGGVAAQLVVPPVRAGTSPTRWEYHCTRFPAEAEEVTSTLNKLGAQGWELAGMTSSPEMHVHTLCAKRALP
jgi:hypothetical protein